MLIMQSLMSSMLSLSSMFCLLGLATYLVTLVFMGAGASYLTDELESAAEHSLTSHGDVMDYYDMKNEFERCFRTVPRGMLTMFFSVTGGQDWYDVLQPLMRTSWIYAVVFLAFEVFVVFGLFNVIKA